MLRKKTVIGDGAGHDGDADDARGACIELEGGTDSPSK